jgi:hypothetical protein
MIKFDVNSVTFGDVLGPAMKIEDQAEADQYLADYVKWLEDRWSSGKEIKTTKMSAIECARHNLGYYAGYYDEETMERVNRLFMTEHPIFGTNTNISPKEAFEKGVKMGKESKLKKKVDRCVKL